MIKVSTEKKEGLKNLITVTVSSDAVKDFSKKAFAKVAKNARLDGFRKGHIPTNVIKQHFGYQIVEETIDAIINGTYRDALKESGLEAVSAPEIGFNDDNKLEGETDVVYTMTVEVEPEVSVKPLDELKLKHLKCEVTDADVESMVKKLQEQQGKWQVKDDLAISNDTLASVNFVLSVDGKAVENDGGKGELKVQPGTTPMIPGFSEQLVGHKAQEQFTIKATFPQEYHAQDLAGKEGTFDITVNSVSERVLPELNSDFYKLYGIKSGDEAEFKALLRKNMERELDRAFTSRTSNDLNQALLAQYSDLLVPQTYIKAETENARENFKRQIASMYRFTPDEKMLNAQKEEFEKEGADRAKLYLIYKALAKSLDYTAPSNETVEHILNQYAIAYEDADKVKEQMRADKKAMANIMNAAYERDLVAKAMEKACDGEVVKSFDEMVNNK